MIKDIEIVKRESNRNSALKSIVTKTNKITKMTQNSGTIHNIQRLEILKMFLNW